MEIGFTGFSIAKKKVIQQKDKLTDWKNCVENLAILTTQISIQLKKGHDLHQCSL